MFSIVARHYEHAEWIKERKAKVAVPAAWYNDFPEGSKYDVLINPAGVTLERLVEIAPNFDTIVFGPYSDSLMANVLCTNIESLFPSTVTGIADETTLLGVPLENKIAIPLRDKLWDHCALDNRKVWLLPTSDPREQWLWYCDLCMRNVNVEHVIISDHAWNNCDILAGSTLTRSKTKRNTQENRKINIYALSIFWDLERIRASGRQNRSNDFCSTS